MKYITRLMLIVALVIAAVASVSYIGLRVLNETQAISRLSSRLERLTGDTWHLQSLTFEIRITDRLSQVVPEWRTVSERVANELTAVTEMGELERFSERSPELADAAARLSSMLGLVERELDEYESVLSEFTNGFTDYPTLTNEEKLAAGSNLMLMRMWRAGDVLASYLDDSLQSVIVRTLEQLDAVRATTVRSLTTTFFIVIGSAAAVVVVMMLAFIRSLKTRFARITSSMQRLADGDLTVRLQASSRDEVSELAGFVQQYIDEFARVLQNIQGIVETAGSLRSDLVAASEESSASVTQIGGNISSIGSTIEDLDRTIAQTSGKLQEINGSIQELQGRIEQQTRSVEESSSAVEEMTASVQSVSKIAADRREAAERLQSVTNEGHANVQSTDEKVNEISESVEEILGIITVINTIASQTSILSMNAAIEAAHAGDYGRGFSVVAAEIRRLSESTNENAKRIKEQLQHVAELARETKTMSETTRESFQSVESEVLSTSRALEEISSTMSELAEGTDAVLRATTQAGEITQSIRHDATAVSSGSATITSDMQHVRDISATVRGGIQEIDVGTREINEMVSNLSQVTGEMTDQIDLLGESVRHFTTGASDASEGADTGTDGPAGRPEEDAPESAEEAPDTETPAAG